MCEYAVESSQFAEISLPNLILSKGMMCFSLAKEPTQLDGDADANNDVDYDYDR